MKKIDLNKELEKYLSLFIEDSDSFYILKLKTLILELLYCNKKKEVKNNNLNLENKVYIAFKTEYNYIRLLSEKHLLNNKTKNILSFSGEKTKQKLDLLDRHFDSIYKVFLLGIRKKYKDKDISKEYESYFKLSFIANRTEKRVDFEKLFKEYKPKFNVIPFLSPATLSVWTNTQKFDKD